MKVTFPSFIHFYWFSKGSLAKQVSTENNNANSKAIVLMGLIFKVR
jgi:hypothetical protein